MQCSDPRCRMGSFADSTEFVTFGELDDSDVALDDESLAPSPCLAPGEGPSPASARPAPPPTFVVYERLVDTRQLRHGMVARANLARDLLVLSAIVVFTLVGGFHALSAAFAADPARSLAASRLAAQSELASGVHTPSVSRPPPTSTASAPPNRSAGAAPAVDRGALVPARRFAPRQLPANPY